MVWHRLRILPKKIELFEIRLKLIKLGYLVEAEKLSDYNDFSLDSIDSSIRMLRKKLNVKSTSKEEKEDEEEADIEQKHDTLVALEGVREKEKENREIFYSEISSILQEGTPNGIIGNAITVAFKNITKEILSSIIFQSVHIVKQEIQGLERTELQSSSKCLCQIRTLKLW